MIKFDGPKKSPIVLKKWRNQATSSNVDRLMFNDETNELVVKFNTGEYYTYFDVDFTDFLDVLNGNAVCTTSGSNRYGTWFVGKFPSVGAAIKRHLSKYNYSRGGSLR